MTHNRSIWGLFALMLALLVGFTAPAAAEFFGCNDQRGQVLYSHTTQSYPSYRHYTTRRSRRYTDEFAARPTRVHHRYSYATYNHRKYSYSNERW